MNRAHGLHTSFYGREILLNEILCHEYVLVGVRSFGHPKSTRPHPCNCILRVSTELFSVEYIAQVITSTMMYDQMMLLFLWKP